MQENFLLQMLLQWIAGYCRLNFVVVKTSKFWTFRFCSDIILQNLLTIIDGLEDIE